MAINSDYVQQMATQLAAFDVQTQQASAARREGNYNAQVKGLSSLKSALSTFSSAVSGLNSGSASSMLVNSAKFSSEGYATATVGSSAVTGSYAFFVEKLASKSQIALSDLDPAALGSGDMEITQGAGSFTVNLAGIDSMEGLAAAINQAPDNAGVQATLVRSGQTVNLVLTSNKTGADQAIAVSGLAGATEKSLSTAADAVVWLGGKDTGIKLENASNTFENVIDGVSLTFNKAHAASDTPLTLDIAQDQSATKGKVDAFINAYNTLMGTMSSLTVSGGEGVARGVLAGDSSVTAIKSLVNQTIRTTFGNANLINFGVRATSTGTLSVDAAIFEKAVAADPEGFESLFTGKGNLIDSLKDSLKVYTSATNGVLTNRVATLNERLKGVNDEFDRIQNQYDNAYARYLKQYTNLMQIMSSMEQTGGMFG